MQNVILLDYATKVSCFIRGGSWNFQPSIRGRVGHSVWCQMERLGHVFSIHVPQTSLVAWAFGAEGVNGGYYMASSASGKDESNPALWLATWAGKMGVSCSLGTTRRVPQEKFPRKPYNKSCIDQTCSVKMAGYWPRSFFASLWTSTPSRSINSQKKRTWPISSHLDLTLGQ